MRSVTHNPTDQIAPSVRTIAEYHNLSPEASNMMEGSAAIVAELASALLSKAPTETQIGAGIGATVCAPLGPIGSMMGGAVGGVFGTIVAAATGKLDGYHR